MDIIKESIFNVGRRGLVGFFIMYKSTYGAKEPRIESRG